MHYEHDGILTLKYYEKTHLKLENLDELQIKYTCMYFLWENKTFFRSNQILNSFFFQKHPKFYLLFQQVAAKLDPSAKGSIHIKQFDVSMFDEIPKLFETIREEFGGVDVLVNNAGLTRSTYNLTGN